MVCVILCLHLYFHSDPNMPEPVRAHWPHYEMTKQAYISLDRDMAIQSEKHFLDTRPRHFWSEVVPGLFNTQHTTMYPDHCASGAVRNIVTSVILAVSLTTALLWWQRLNGYTYLKQCTFIAVNKTAFSMHLFCFKCQFVMCTSVHVIYLSNEVYTYSNTHWCLSLNHL